MRTDGGLRPQTWRPSTGIRAIEGRDDAVQTCDRATGQEQLRVQDVNGRLGLARECSEGALRHDTGVKQLNATAVLDGQRRPELHRAGYPKEIVKGHESITVPNHKPRKSRIGCVGHHEPRKNCLFTGTYLLDHNAGGEGDLVDRDGARSFSQDLQRLVQDEGRVGPRANENDVPRLGESNCGGGDR